MNTQTLLSLTLALFVFGGSSVSSAAEFPVFCPRELSADAIQIVQAPSGWTPFTPSLLRLHGVGIMFGPPSEKKDSKPDKIEQHKNGQSSTWILGDRPDLPKWINCGYGAGNEVTLSKELPANTSMCKVSYTKKDQYAITEVTTICASI